MRYEKVTRLAYLPHTLIYNYVTCPWPLAWVHRKAQTPLSSLSCSTNKYWLIWWSCATRRNLQRTAQRTSSLLRAPENAFQHPTKDKQKKTESCNYNVPQKKALKRVTICFIAHRKWQSQQNRKEHQNLQPCRVLQIFWPCLHLFNTIQFTIWDTRWLCFREHLRKTC